MTPIPPEVGELKAAGYICIRLTPIMWRARGPFGTVDIYPYQGLYRRYGPVQPYTSAVLAVRALIEPYELPSAEEVEARRVWQEGLAALYRTLSPTALCK